MSTHERSEVGKAMRPRLPADDAYWDDLAGRVTAAASVELGGAVGADTRMKGDTPTRVAAESREPGDPPTLDVAAAARAAPAGHRPDRSRPSPRRAGSSWQTRVRAATAASSVPPSTAGFALGDFAAPLAAAAMLALIAGYVLMPDAPAARMTAASADAEAVALVEAALSPADPLARALLRDAAPPPIVGLLALRGTPADISTSQEPR